MEIYKAIPAIISEIGAVKKEKKNAQQGYAYRGVDDFMNALNPLLARHKVCIIPKVTDAAREERTNPKTGSRLTYTVLTVEFSFYASDGSFVAATVKGEGMDSGDKSSNKAMSAAFKYACMQVFCVPTEELHDPDETSHEVEPVSIRKASKEQIAALFELGVDPDKVCEHFGVANIEDMPYDKLEKVIKKKQESERVAVEL